MIGQYVSSSSSRVVSHLNLTSTRTSDGGLYACVASNRAGEKRHAARLNVYGAPIAVEDRVSTLKAIEGRPLELQCPVAGFPVKDVVWSKGE